MGGIQVTDLQAGRVSQTEGGVGGWGEGFSSDQVLPEKLHTCSGWTGEDAAEAETSRGGRVRSSFLLSSGRQDQRRPAGPEGTAPGTASREGGPCSYPARNSILATHDLMACDTGSSAASGEQPGRPGRS